MRCRRCGRPFTPRYSQSGKRVYCYGCAPTQNAYPRLAMPAEQLLELDDDARADAVARLRRAMAFKYPRLYRINPDGTVDYVGPTIDDDGRIG